MGDNEQKDVIVREVCILDELGLHARPAAQLAQEAQKFASEVQLVINGQAADAKSILDILSLAAARGCGVQLHVSGEDAEKAADHLCAFFKKGLIRD